MGITSEKDQLTSLEDLVTKLQSYGNLRISDAVFKWCDYCLDGDGLYHLARDIDKVNQEIDLIGKFREDHIRPRRLYRMLEKDVRKLFNKPVLPFKTYFLMIDLISSKLDDYKGAEGYIKLARDINDQTGKSQNLGYIWAGARKFRVQLGWEEKISMQLKVYDFIAGCLDEDVSRSVGERLYQGDEGYIRFSKAVRERTGYNSHLKHIWLSARAYHDQLNWSSMINLPISVFDLMDKLLHEDSLKFIAQRAYHGKDGGIRLADHISEQTRLFSPAVSCLGWRCQIPQQL